MEQHASAFPLSREEGQAFVDKLGHLLQLSVDQGGHWTSEANGLYKELFEVGPAPSKAAALVSLGTSLLRFFSSW